MVGRQGFLTLTNVEETHRPVIPLIRHSVSSDVGGHTSPLSTPHSLILTRSIFNFFFYCFFYFFLSLGYLQASSIFPPRGGRLLLSAEMDRWEAGKRDAGFSCWELLTGASGGLSERGSARLKRGVLISRAARKRGSVF